MANKNITIGPTTIANAVGNLAAPAAAGAGAVGYTASATRLVVTRIRIVNRTAGAVTYSQFLGATGAGAAGTEFGWSGVSVPANSFVELYCRKPLEGSSGFLTGVAGAATSLTFEADAEAELV